MYTVYKTAHVEIYWENWKISHLTWETHYTLY